MLTSKRKYKRFDLPLTIKFRPSNGAAEYSTGVTKDFSCKGLGLEADDFEFIRYENLELNLKLPESENSVSLFGGVVWERQIGDKGLAGIKLKIKNKDMRNEIEKIFSCSNIPMNSIYSNDPEYMIKGVKKKKPVSKLAEQEKKRLEQPEKLALTKGVKKKKPVSKLAEQEKKRLEQPEKSALTKGVKKKKPVSKLTEQKKKPLEQPEKLALTKEVKNKKSVSKLAEQNLEQPEKFGFIKQYNKSGSKCKVTFRLPKKAAPDAQKVTIVGDFNEWDISKIPMNRVGNGDFLATLDLNSKREYKFKYLIDGNLWENDWCADKYVPNAFGSDDSVVIV